MKAIPMVVLFLTFTSTATAQKFQVVRDPYKGQEIGIVAGIATKACPGNRNHLDNVSVDLIVGFEKGRPLYALRYWLNSSDPQWADPGSAGWAFLNSGDEALQGLIDGEPISFVAPAESKREVKSGYRVVSIQEVIYYLTTREVLERIAESKVFRFRANGSRRSVEKCWSGKQLEVVKDFLARTQSWEARKSSQ